MVVPLGVGILEKDSRGLRWLIQGLHQGHIAENPLGVRPQGYSPGNLETCCGISMFALTW